MSNSSTIAHRIRLVAFAVLAMGFIAANSQGRDQPWVILGDANGDALFDHDDIENVLGFIMMPSRGPDPDHLNVSRPCGVKVDMEDMRRLRAALAGIRDGVPMESHCHDGRFIGRRHSPELPPSSPEDMTLDAQFEKVAAIVPEFAGLTSRTGRSTWFSRTQVRRCWRQRRRRWT